MHVFGLRRRHQPHALIRRALAITAAVLAACTLTTGGAAGSPDGAASSCSTASSSPITLTNLSGNLLSEGPLTQLYAFCAVGTLPPPPKGAVGYSAQLSVNGVGIRFSWGTSSDRSGDVLYWIQVIPNSIGTKGGLGCGPNTVSVDFTPAYMQAPRRGQVSKQDSTVYSASLIAQCPSVSLSPSTIALAAQPATVVVTGSLWYPGSQVQISLAGQSYQAITTSADLGSGGGFSQPVTAQGLTCGSYPVTVSQFVSDVAGGRSIFAFSTTTTLNISCNEKLSMNPGILIPGEATQVTGTGFVPGQPVTLTWRAPGGGPPLLGEQAVAADTGGGISTYFLVMPNDLPGPRQLVATQGKVSISANALVQGGPMEPSAGGQLLYRGD